MPASKAEPPAADPRSAQWQALLNRFAAAGPGAPARQHRIEGPLPDGADRATLLARALQSHRRSRVAATPPGVALPPLP
jgi:hypothetical protein